MPDSQLPLFPDSEEEDDQRYVTVAKLGEIPEGQGRAYAVGKVMVAVFQVDGRFYAIDDFCPHQGASLAEGYLDGCTVACPWHHWRFSIEDGSWLDNPKISVQKYGVRVKGQNIQVQLPSEST